jgi:pilus assembly protein Flp/PilA
MVQYALQKIVRFVRKDEGVTAIEYALLAVLIALALIAGAAFLGTSLDDSLSNIGEHVDP